MAEPEYVEFVAFALSWREDGKPRSPGGPRAIVSGLSWPGDTREEESRISAFDWAGALTETNERGWRVTRVRVRVPLPTEDSQIVVDAVVEDD